MAQLIGFVLTELYLTGGYDFIGTRGHSPLPSSFEDLHSLLRQCHDMKQVKVTFIKRKGKSSKQEMILKLTR